MTPMLIQRYALLAASCLALYSGQAVHAAPSDALAQVPTFLTEGQTPLVLLVMSRDHKLFHEAYNDYSDLDDDGQLDIRYKPGITYEGYFDPDKCYVYNSGVTPARFQPSSAATSKKCTAKWSGNFLNYVTTSRMDALRKVLYGGYRVYDTPTLTVLERAMIPTDAHTWAKEYRRSSSNTDADTITLNGYDIRDYTPLTMPAAADATHLFANVTLTSATSAPLLRVLSNTTYRPWSWVSIEKFQATNKCVDGQSGPLCTAGGGTMTDYHARVEVCNTTVGVESNCIDYQYDDGGTDKHSWKPTGILHDYASSIHFGLLSGSYGNNLNGGIMRKSVFPFTNEYEKKTGVFYKGATPPTGVLYQDSSPSCDYSYRKADASMASGTACTQGIVATIDKFRIVQYNFGSGDYSGGYIDSRPMNDSEFRDWGNPLGEMVYEGLRYFAGKNAPTSAFVANFSNESSLITLPALTTSGSWGDPYSSGGTNPYFPACSKPYQFLISDVYTSFDSDSVPGSPFSTFTGDLSGASFFFLGQTMWNKEFGAAKNVVVGFVDGAPSTTDGMPTAKSVSSFAKIRGLPPAETTMQGSYSASALAYFGHIQDLHSASGNQKTSTYSVALSAPLPDFNIPVDGKTVRIVPFVKTVSNPGSGYYPNSQLVDLFIEDMYNLPGAPTDAGVNGGRAYLKFRVNHDTVEQGGDFDQDALTSYIIQVTAGNLVEIQLDSKAASAGRTQHIGYVISGTTADGVYLVVRDCDTVNPGVAAPCTNGGNNTEYDYAGDTPNLAGVPLPLTDTRSFTPSGVEDTTQLKNPLWYAAKWGGFDDTNANNFPDDTEWNVTSGGTTPANYFLVTNPTALKAQLKKAFEKIRQDSGSAASLTANSFTFNSDTMIFQSNFNSNGWTGELVAFPISENGIGAPAWKAEEKLATLSGNARTIITYDPDKSWGSRGIPFRWNSMDRTSTGTAEDGTLEAALNKNAAGTLDSKGSERVAYLRGDEDADFRARPKIQGSTSFNKLGDMINSQATFVAAPSFGYGDLGYAAYYAAKANRTPMVYVGANDGMLHGFQATQTGTGSGMEKLAYIPSEMYRRRPSSGGSRLSMLTDPNYGKSGLPHRYFVDASPVVGDICLNTSCGAAADWKTMLVGGLGGGGQAIYALDISSPENFSEGTANSIVMWEFKDSDHDGSTATTDISGDVNLGYTYGRPFIVQLCTQRETSAAKFKPAKCLQKKWFVMFNNGYKSEEADGSAGTGKAALYVVHAATGYLATTAPITVGTAGDGPNNGLSELAPIDLDGDGTVDLVYAGDLKGNVWRFDFYKDDPAQWTVSFSGTPFYTAKDWASTPNKQPITTAPDVASHPISGVIVAFGTGTFVFDNDKTDTKVQTVYGIWDKLWDSSGNFATNTYVDSTNHNNLQEQNFSSNTVADDTTIVIDGGTEVTTNHSYRGVSSNAVNWSSKLGWYLRLTTQDTAGTKVVNDTGERVVYNPRIYGNNILEVTSTIPNPDICKAGGTSWVTYLDVETGGNLGFNVFVDYGQTTNFNLTGNSSGATTKFAASRETGTGIGGAPAKITGAGTVSTMLTTGSTGTKDYVDVNLGQASAGRLSWRELLND